MLIDAEIDDAVLEAISQIELLTVNDEPVQVSLVNKYELAIMFIGGVKLADIEFAIQQWLKADTPAKNKTRNDFGYIRTIALRRRAEVLIAKDEA